MSNGFAVNWESREKQQPSLGNWLLRSALPRQLHHLFVFAPLLICTTHKSQRISLSLFSFLHLFFPSFPTFTCSVHVRLQIAFKPILPRRVSSVMNKLVNLVFFFSGELREFCRVFSADTEPWQAFPQKVAFLRFSELFFM